ncbi:MAG: hypothetical protein AAF586_04395 [Planctomycetota bacterium]
MVHPVIPSSLLDELDRLESLRAPEKTELCKRHFARFVVRGDAELQPMTRSKLDATPIEIKLRDIGRGGFGFIAEQPLEPGTPWRCAFLDRGYAVGEVACVIRHCDRIGGRLYLAGAQIVVPTGLLATLGVDPARIDEPPAGPTDAGDLGFVEPDDCV